MAIKEIEEKKEEEPKVEVKEEGQYTLSAKDLEKFTKQCQAEHKMALDFLRPRIAMWLKRLKLYNNQKRDAKAVGDPLLFTVQNALLASLYDDRMSTIWEAEETGDLQVEEHLNIISEKDYQKMEKPDLDYDWLWDALFYAYGIVNLTYFNRKKQTPEPELIDPAVFLYDPKGESIDGKGELHKGGMRFCGTEVLLTKNQMNKISGFFDISKVKSGKKTEDLSQQASMARQEAQGGQQTIEVDKLDLGDNTQFKLTEWRTFFDGNRVIATFSNEMKQLNRYQVIKEDYWGLIKKEIWPISHQFQGVSVPDLTEDKQRKRSVVTNLAVKVLKADLYPMYTYDRDKVKNRGDLSFGFNKFIPVDGPPANVITPLHKASPNMELYNYVMELLDTGAQRATATPELQQGIISKEARTLGELNLVAQKIDTRYSLVVKTLMKGEKKFWRLWYRLYKAHFKDGISKKVVRLAGVLSGQFREFTRENFIAKVDPDVKIVSKILSEAKQMKQLSRYVQVVEMAGADPTTNRRFIMKQIARLSGLDRNEIDKMYPATLDEMLAREQNEELNNDNPVPVSPEDNHQVHIEVHSEANATDATFAHIETHKKAMVMQRERPELFPHLQREQEGQASPGEGLQPGQEGQVQGDDMAMERQSKRENISPSTEASQSL